MVKLASSPSRHAIFTRFLTIAIATMAGSSSSPPTTSSTPASRSNLIVEFFTKLTSSKFVGYVVRVVVDINAIWVDDPRKLIHSFKAALAITLVSMVYYIRLFYDGVGDNGMWAILTVVVVFEYGVGATISKCFNRCLGTLIAAALGVLAEAFASLFGPTVKPVILGFLVFFLVAATTFSRFIPNIKKNYDYGVLIYILTFTLITVSGYRVEKILKLACERGYTIIIGIVTSILVSMCVFPVWAGEDLHKHTVTNLENLGSFLQEFGGQYYKISKDDKSDAYKSIFNSKDTQESLARSAWWEIGHGKFLFRHPWEQYLNIGVHTRQCALHVEALNGYLDAKNEIPSYWQILVQEPCMRLSSELGKTFKELENSMSLMEHPSTAQFHIKNCRMAEDDLNNALKEIERNGILQAVPVIAVTSILVDIINCVETLSDAIQKLSKKARFKNSDSEDKSKHCGNSTTPVDDEHPIVIMVPSDEIRKETEASKQAISQL